MTNEYFTEAIVLDKDPVGEADSQIYLYTKELGRVTARAISARKIISKLASHLEPGNIVQIRLIHKNRFQAVDAVQTGALPKTTANLAVLRLVKDLTGEGQQDREMWELLKSGTASGISALSVLGFDSQFAVCENCGNEKPSYFVFGRLEYICSSCFVQSGRPVGFALS